MAKASPEVFKQYGKVEKLVVAILLFQDSCFDTRIIEFYACNDRNITYEGKSETRKYSSYHLVISWGSVQLLCSLLKKRYTSLAYVWTAPVKMNTRQNTPLCRIITTQGSIQKYCICWPLFTGLFQIFCRFDSLRNQFSKSVSGKSSQSFTLGLDIGIK